ncbi:MAG TPA: hypothetical protein VMU69_13540 [Bradyrhizobium sp.]|nr:hypothetical protein [Bradyrhizobium sp.]
MSAAAMKSTTVKSADAEAAAVKSSNADTTPVETSTMEATATVESTTSAMEATAATVKTTTAMEASTSTVEATAAATVSSTATRGVGWICRRCRNNRCGDDRKQCPANLASFRHFLLPAGPKRFNPNDVREFQKMQFRAKQRLLEIYIRDTASNSGDGSPRPAHHLRLRTKKKTPVGSGRFR